jgi:hypothetical protein
MPFGSLWLPVVGSAVAVFVVSSIVHMLLRYHKADYKALPDEESVAAALRKAGPAPGLYFLPHCADFSQLKDPAVRKKFEDGPIAIMAVRPSGVPGMGKNLVQWFLLCLFASFIAGYVGRHTLGFGADGLNVMRITGTVAFAAYAFGYFHDSIWQGIPWSNSLRGLLDAVLYSVTTGLVFRCLWPAA